MIKISNLRKQFGDEQVLQGINLEIDDGDIIALVGGSGSGKSVLLRNVVGLMEPDSGEVLINGTNVQNASQKQLNQMRNQIGMLFQGGALFDSMTVFGNLAFPLREKTNYSENEIQEIVAERLG